MARRTRYVTEMVEQTTTVQQLACDNCGGLVDVEPLKRPEGWFTAYWTEGGDNKTRDFCEWVCFLGWANAMPEDGPSELLEQLEASVAAHGGAK